MKKAKGIFIPFLASLGSLLMGYGIGVIGSTLLFIKSEFSLNNVWLSTIASMVIPGTMAGVLLPTFLDNKWRRSTFIVLSAITFIISFILLTFATSTFELILGRFLSGVAIGIILVVVPLYLAEIAPTNLRGKFVTIFQLSITFGAVLGYFISYWLAHFRAWRVMFACGFVFAFLQLISVFYLPKPREIFTATEDTQSNSKIYSRKYLRPLLIGNGLSILQQLTGINAVAFYAPQILKSSSMHNLAAIGGGFVIMLANFLFTIISLFAFDHYGRRPILLLSVLIQWIVLSILTFINFSGHEILVLTLLTIYIASFSFGLGPGMWLIASEIFPFKIRSKAMGITIFINNIFAFLVIVTFLPLLAVYGKTLVFGIYSIISFLGIIFIYFFIPETKGKSLEEITQ